MDQLNYYDLENILSKCVSGEIDMHEPIEVTNKIKNQRTEMGVLKHLLLLCQSDKKSLIHILSVLRCKLKETLLELINDNSFIRQYIQNIIHEWRLDITPFDLLQDGLDQCGYSEGDDLFNYQALVDEQRCYQKGGSQLVTLEQALKERQQAFTPMTKDYAGQIQGKIKGLYNECNECVGRVKGYSADTMTKNKLIHPQYIDILTDLSSKSKPTYLEYSNKFKEDEETFATFLNESHDLDIPDNIHTIFLNYLITLNMIKKEMNYISHSFKDILSDMQPKMVILTKFMDGLNELDNYNVIDEGVIDSDVIDSDVIDEGVIDSDLQGDLVITDPDESSIFDNIKNFSFF